MQHCSYFLAILTCNVITCPIMHLLFSSHFAEYLTHCYNYQNWIFTLRNLKLREVEESMSKATQIINDQDWIWTITLICDGQFNTTKITEKRKPQWGATLGWPVGMSVGTVLLKLKKNHSLKISYNKSWSYLPPHLP